jgi:hypothetical protein
MRNRERNTDAGLGVRTKLYQGLVEQGRSNFLALEEIQKRERTAQCGNDRLVMKKLIKTEQEFTELGVLKVLKDVVNAQTIDYYSQYIPFNWKPGYLKKIGGIRREINSHDRILFRSDIEIGIDGVRLVVAEQDTYTRSDERALIAWRADRVLVTETCPSKLKIAVTRGEGKDMYYVGLEEIRGDIVLNDLLPLGNLALMGEFIKQTNVPGKDVVETLKGLMNAYIKNKELLEGKGGLVERGQFVHFPIQKD